MIAFEANRLHVAAGEFVAVVGPSGSGKTTLLSLLGGMLAPSSGQIYLDGRSVYRLSVAERAELRRERLGFVFQSFNLVPYLTALANVQLPLLLAGKSPEEQQRTATGLLERLGLAERLHHRPSELSAGQQQRVALARTLANDPAVILADEPTGNLDPESRETALQFLGDLHRKGRTIVMVTHDPQAAARAQRVMTLRNGRIADPGLLCTRAVA
ncbi:MAG: ABC transporter ATP-binding protein [Pirellulales bacterium]